MFKFFGILLLSLVFTGSLSVPFINLLYKLKFQTEEKRKDIFGKDTPIFKKLHKAKIGTPVGGGILVVIAVVLFSAIFYLFTKFTINWTTIILFFTFLSFALLGFYDDWQKFFKLEKRGFWGLRFRHKFILQWTLALIVGYLLFHKMNLNSISIPITNYQLPITIFFIPFAALIIVGTTNAFNITDGLDGLAGGLLMIALSTFWVLAGFSPFAGDVSLFIAVLMGSLLAFLYFNIYPARFFMGDAGSMAFGSTLGVLALMTNSVAVLPIIGGVFVAEALSTLIQWGSKWLRGKKVFLIAPLHHHFEAKGWDETKVTMRFWLAGAALAFIGLFLATFGRA